MTHHYPSVLKIAQSHFHGIAPANVSHRYCLENRFSEGAEKSYNAEKNWIFSRLSEFVDAQN